MPFKKGHAGGPGRPEGSKNKNFTNVNCWLEVVWNHLADMQMEQRLEHSWKAINALLPKIPVLPATPGDSVNNVAATLAILESAKASQTLPNAQTFDSSGVTNGNGRTDH